MSRAGRFAIGVAGGVIALAVVALLGGESLIEAGFHLAFGWVFFLFRVLPKASLDLRGTLIAVACMAGLAVGGHAFLRWLHSGIRGTASEGAWCARWTGMLLALVVTMFVAGIAAVGIAHQTGWLLRSPGLMRSQGTIRMVAARMTSSSRLKSLGSYIQNYDATYEGLPGAVFDSRGDALHGWHTQLLGFYGEVRRYQSIDLRRPWNDPVNADKFKDIMNMYQVIGAGEEYDAEGFALSHYAANARVMGGPVPRRLASIKDGRSHTILIGEAWAAYKPWGHPASWRDPALGIRTVPDSFGSPLSADLGQFVMADGSVRTVSKNVSRATLKALATPDGGETITEEW